MKWISVEEELPEIGVEVLAWNTCENCRDGKPHTHNCLYTGYPVHGPYIAKLCPPDLHLVQIYNKKGDHSYDFAKNPFWSPIAPTHWQEIRSPYEMD